MNVFVLFGTLLWFALLLALFLCLIVLLIIASVKKSWRFAIKAVVGTVGATLAVTGLYAGLMYLMFRPYDPTSEAELRSAYAADFGNLPPAGITVLKARQIVVSDSGAQWLLFKATPEEISRHIAMGFTSTDSPPSDFRGDAGANAPKWWQPPAGRLEYYENRSWKTASWSSGWASVGVDRGSNLIWFATTKVD